MPALKIIDVVLGLTFVYLLLSLLCTAINEYIAGMLNKRGKVLLETVENLLGNDHALIEAFYNHPLIDTIFPCRAQIVARHHWVRKWPWGTRWAPRLIYWLRPSVRKQRRPSYLSARNFALALVSVTDFADRLRDGANPQQLAPNQPAQPNPPQLPPPGANAAPAAPGQNAVQPPAGGAAAADAQANAAPNAGQPVAPANAGAGAQAPVVNANAGAGVNAAQGGGGQHAAGPATLVATPAKLERTFDALMQQSAAEVSELLRDPAVARILGNTSVPPEVRDALVDVVTGADRRVQKLQDAVEVWFNNAMDRVSGTYKRYTQIALFLIGLVTAILLNADTVTIWNQLSSNDALRADLAKQAIAFAQAHRDPATGGGGQAAPAPAGHADSARSAAAPAAGGPNAAGQPAGPPGFRAPNGAVPRITSSDSASVAVDSVACSSTDSAQVVVARALQGNRLSCGQARILYAFASAQIDSTGLPLGWTRADGVALGVVPLTWPWHWHLNWKLLLRKLLGVLLTALAISLGAPFWFDMLNKVINIRAAGPAPDERPKSPAATPKRPAEQPVK